MGCRGMFSLKKERKKDRERERERSQIHFLTFKEFIFVAIYYYFGKEAALTARETIMKEYSAF